MARSILANANPHILIWARNSIGYTLREAANKSGIAYRTLREAENDIKRLSVTQLRKLATLYKRPLPIFYLKNIPQDLELPDFRSRRNEEDLEILSGKIKLQIREIYEKKKIAEELYKSLNISYKYDLIEMFTDSALPEYAAKKIRTLLNIHTEDLRTLKDNKVLKFWINKIEQLGILVFQYQKINPNIMRGFVFANTPYPTLAINQRDTFYARVFTLVHEISHIIINKSGIIDPFYSISDNREKIERFCNSVASETLIPQDEFKNVIKNKSFKNKPEVEKFLAKASSIWKVSYSVILISLKKSKKISRQLYNELTGELDTKKKKSIGGGDYYRLFFSQTSNNFLQLVFKGLKSNQITYYDAMKYLKVSYKVLNTIEQKLVWES